MSVTGNTARHTTMDTALIARLVVKDWSLQRRFIAVASVAGLASLLLLGHGGNGTFYAGTVLMITVLIGVGVQLVMATVLNERTEKTLPFVMSLPISVREYTTAKMLANLLLFLVPWTLLLIGTAAVLGLRPGMPPGLLPFATLLLVELLAAYCLVLAVALVSESSGWTIGTIVFTNLFLQGFLYQVARIPAIEATMRGPEAVWNRPALTLLAVECAVIVLILAVTYRLQSRKTDFL